MSREQSAAQFLFHLETSPHSRQPWQVLRTPALRPLYRTVAFRDKYIESCSMYGCDPVPLLLQVIDMSLEQGCVRRSPHRSTNSRARERIERPVAPL